MLWLRFKNFEARKLRGQLQIAQLRVDVYKALWEKTDLVRSLSRQPDDGWRKAADSLTEWYYKDGNGIYLSLESADLFLKVSAITSNRPAIIEMTQPLRSA